MRCWPPGPDLATTPGRATCTPAPRRWWRRAASRATLPGCARLPGIGPYTAAAVGAIAFGLPAVPVDGNVERVTARLFAIEAPLPGAKPAIQAAAAALGADPDAMARPSDFAQALFDLGATICTPDQPGLRAVPVARSVCRPARRHRRGAAAAGAEEAAAAAPRRAFLADRCGQECAAAPAPAARPAGRHDRAARHRLARRRLAGRGGAAPRADAGGLAPGRAGAARLHPFRAASGRCSRRRWSGSTPTGFCAQSRRWRERALPSVMRKCVRAAHRVTG